MTENSCAMKLRVIGWPSGLRDLVGCNSLVLCEDNGRDSMAWTEITRGKCRREGLRYVSDTTDAEWALIEPHIPSPSTRGRPHETCLRPSIGFNLTQSGCLWRAHRPALQHSSTLFLRLEYHRTLQLINHALLVTTREVRQRTLTDHRDYRRPATIGREVGSR
jgi:putative transposase